MNNKVLHFCATDKEIFDLLMSSRQRITDSILLELAKDRGIFYSSKDSREILANSISLLPHDFHDLNSIIEHRESLGKAEKLTSIALSSALTIDDIKDVVSEYKEATIYDEKVLTHQNGANKYIMTAHYSEIDYSKTRLIQRRQKEAGIEFIVEEEKTIIRMPSNDKAREIVNNLKKRLDAKKEINIPVETISLTEFSSPELRTEFFTFLITKISGFKLENVTNIKVESKFYDSQEYEFLGDDDQDAEQAKQEMLAVVKNVALKGQSLLASKEYQQLKRGGFFITSIIWRSKQKSFPNPIFEFEAGFEYPEDGKGFKYNVRGCLHCHNGEYTKTLRPINQADKNELIDLIEKTAALALTHLKHKQATQDELPIYPNHSKDVAA